MQRLSSVPAVGRYSIFNHLWVVALLAGLATTFVDKIIAVIATPIVYAPPEYASFTWLALFAGCMGGAIGAYLVFIALWRFARRPVRSFLIVSVVVLILSYGIPILPIVNPLPRFAGVNWGIAFTLMFIHTVTAAIIVSTVVSYRKRQLASDKPESELPSSPT